eukprot:GEMP01010347.1.p1 GENE.GEMP01010347.1~~GEMP01010347.1.p1  ORF type:complete len:730 (+),score=112.20 GEMP01010347.1:106-2295(+)
MGSSPRIFCFPFDGRPGTKYKMITRRRVKRMISQFEPRDINLAELCVAKHPEKKWRELSSKEQVAIFRVALKPLYLLLDPHCGYLKGWNLCVFCALMYTAIIVPYEAAFLETVWWDTIFICDRIVDFIFIKDMCLKFFIKVRIRTENGTVCLRTRKKIAIHYLGTWFMIDLLSILPFFLVPKLGGNDPSFSKFQAGKMLRVLRLIELLRVMKGFKIIKQWRNEFSFSYASLHIGKCLVGVMLASHWAACIWGAIGRNLGQLDNGDWCDNGKWLWTPKRAAEGTSSSWITKLYWRDPQEPQLNSDNPCHHWDLWVVSWYFSIMTITSIGFGDIVPTRREEYVTLSCFMLVGGLFWTYLIGSFCSIISNLDPFEIEFEQQMDLMNDMLEEKSFSPDISFRFREYLRETVHLRRMERYKHLVLGLSPKLRGEFYEYVARKSLRNIWYFKHASHEFLVQISMSMQTCMYEPRECIHLRDCLCVVSRGTVARNGKVLVSGNTWGEDIILSSAELRCKDLSNTLTYCEITYLKRAELLAAVAIFPSDAEKLRWATVRLAMCRVILGVSRELARVAKYHGGDLSQMSPTMASRRLCVMSMTDPQHALRTQRDLNGFAASSEKWEDESAAGRRRSMMSLLVTSSQEPRPVGASCNVNDISDLPKKRYSAANDALENTNDNTRNNGGTRDDGAYARQAPDSLGVLKQLQSLSDEYKGLGHKFEKLEAMIKVYVAGTSK